MTINQKLRPVRFHWFRLETSINHNSKLLMLAPSDRWFFVAILALKRDGTLDRHEDNEKLQRAISVQLRLTSAEADELRRRLQDERLIDEHWQPTGWDKYQSNADSSTERVRRHREREKTKPSGETKTKRFRNRSETLESRVDKSRGDNSTETDSGASAPLLVADKKLASKKRASPVSINPPDGWTLEEWNAYLEARRSKGHPRTEASLLLCTGNIYKTRDAGIPMRLIIDEMVATGWRTVKPEFFENKNHAKNINAGQMRQSVVSRVAAATGLNPDDPNSYDFEQFNEHDGRDGSPDGGQVVVVDGVTIRE